VLATGAGALLLAGLWTPVAGTWVAGIEVWKVFLHPGDPWICILLGTLGAALAMLGPGAWSVDARLFGWKRIHLPARKK
jgi:putative oxidoreductase